MISNSPVSISSPPHPTPTPPLKKFLANIWPKSMHDLSAWRKYTASKIVWTTSLYLKMIKRRFGHSSYFCACSMVGFVTVTGRLWSSHAGSENDVVCHRIWHTIICFIHAFGCVSFCMSTRVVHQVCTESKNIASYCWVGFSVPNSKSS